MAVEFEWDTVVIGTNLAAALSAQQNNWHILFNKEPAFFKFNTLTSKELEYQVWESIASDLSLRALNPFGDKITLIRVVDDGIEVICDNRKYKVRCNNIRFHDDDNIENFPFEKVEVQCYRACDWFRVTSGANHDYWSLENEDDFVKKIYFIPKKTLPKYKDCVSESIIDKHMLKHIDYTSTMARLKTTQTMKEAGILGTKHTQTYRYPIKMELLERQIFEIKKEVFQKIDNYVLDTRVFK